MGIRIKTLQGYNKGLDQDAVVGRIFPPIGTQKFLTFLTGSRNPIFFKNRISSPMPKNRLKNQPQNCFKFNFFNRLKKSDFCKKSDFLPDA